MKIVKKHIAEKNKIENEYFQGSEHLEVNAILIEGADEDEEDILNNLDPDLMSKEQLRSEIKANFENAVFTTKKIDKEIKLVSKLKIKFDEVWTTSHAIKICKNCKTKFSPLVKEPVSKKFLICSSVFTTLASLVFSHAEAVGLTITSLVVIDALPVLTAAKKGPIESINKFTIYSSVAYPFYIP